MINIENELFTRIATALRAAFDGVCVVGEYVSQPPRFPAVYIEEMDNSVNRRTRDSGDIENYADVMYEVNIYSNRNAGKKAECKAIAALVDEQFAGLGFTRTFLQPTPNLNDATIYRMTGRWTATVSKDEKIYWR